MEPRGHGLPEVAPCPDLGPLLKLTLNDGRPRTLHEAVKVANVVQREHPGSEQFLGPDKVGQVGARETTAGIAVAVGIEGLEPVTPDRWLAEGEVVSIAGQDFAVLHCPGHTPGHVAFVSAALGVAVVGDVIFRGSVGRTDFPYGDHAALIEAILAQISAFTGDARRTMT